MYLKTQVEVKDIKLSGTLDQTMDKLSVKFSFGSVFFELFDLENNDVHDSRGSFRLTYITELNVPEALISLMEAYCDGKQLKPNYKARAISIADLSINDGPEQPLSMYPKKLEIFLLDQIDKNSSRLKSFVSTLRWRFNIDTNINPCSRINSYCSKNKNTAWRLIKNLEVRKCYLKDIAIPINLAFSEDTLELSVAEDGEPTGHELLREAKEISSVSVRASLIMGIASVEVRLKDLISSRSPSSEWLIKSIPSPPIPKIISNYLPELFDEYKDEILAFKKTNHCILICKQIEKRNITSHTGELPQSIVIHELLYSVEQFLWFCDFLSGFEWAREYFDEEVSNCFSK
ncbi:hypothetical protein [Pseudocolwellia agarivorans]|uniref:hypothetical protein n=1 Tax=Pseudocolwellia agarivorans TaxID=1911682 RepID=UPI0009843B08|nr:hypothetical protein [Pseudocolwellia agarivorans]